MATTQIAHIKTADTTGAQLAAQRIVSTDNVGGGGCLIFCLSTIVASWFRDLRRLMSYLI